MENFFIPGTIVLGAVLLFVVALISIKNHAIQLAERVRNAKSNISGQLKRRDDLIHNLVDVVVQYAKHERDTLNEIVAKRNETTSVGSQLQIIVEAYPELKASSQYTGLMTELSVTENRVFDYRQIYNDAVLDYATYIKQWPASVVVKEKEAFEYLEFPEVLNTAPQNLFK